MEVTHYIFIKTIFSINCPFLRQSFTAKSSSMIDIKTYPYLRTIKYKSYQLLRTKIYEKSTVICDLSTNVLSYSFFRCFISSIKMLRRDILCKKCLFFLKAILLLGPSIKCPFLYRHRCTEYIQRPPMPFASNDIEIHDTTGK